MVCVTELILGQSLLEVMTKVNKVVKMAFGKFESKHEYKSWDIILQIHKMLVRLHLEYCLQFWSLHFRKDMVAIEREQRKFTRKLNAIDSCSYKETLDRLGLFSLKQRLL